MKKIYLLLTLIVVFAIQINAKNLKGKIITGSDTSTVMFKIPKGFLSTQISYEKLQKKVKYFDVDGTKKILRPENAEEFRFMYKGKEIRFLSRRNNLYLGGAFSIRPRLFLKLEVDGKLKLFKYYGSQNSSGSFGASSGGMYGGVSMNTVDNILQKGDGDLMQPNFYRYKKELKEFLNDCPELCEKIDNKELKKRDLEEIVRFYNENCK
ncbi:hypothetical protein [Saccharicrinis sp. FJH54]|uniref:hypothetical protein n=1 Tax=Saccharicrinis sp. FJH54 TaxID=3344665 RepID=UPI0035D453D7